MILTCDITIALRTAQSAHNRRSCFCGANYVETIQTDSDATHGLGVSVEGSDVAGSDAVGGSRQW